MLSTFSKHVTTSGRMGEDSSNNRDDLFHSLQVDASVLGKDPSTGDKNKVFNIRLNDSRGLTKGLSPSHLSSEGASRFTEGLSDVTAFPRGEGTSDVTEGSMMLDVPVQVLAGIYAYLRDGMACGFSPQKLLAQQIDALQSFQQKETLGQTAEKSPSEPIKTHQSNLCKHCGTGLHASNVRCPWKSKPAGEAKKEAAKVLAQLASPLTLPGSDQTKEGA